MLVPWRVIPDYNLCRFLNSHQKTRKTTGVFNTAVSSANFWPQHRASLKGKRFFKTWHFMVQSSTIFSTEKPTTSSSPGSEFFGDFAFSRVRSYETLKKYNIVYWNGGCCCSPCSPFNNLSNPGWIAIEMHSFINLDSFPLTKYHLFVNSCFWFPW